MKEIALKFGGTIYMENLGEQEEEERIKIFDSDKNYLDDFGIEILEDTAKMHPNTCVQDVIDDYAAKMAEKESVEALLDYLGLDWIGVFSSESALYKATGCDSKNEWVNHIGKYLVKIYEY